MSKQNSTELSENVTREYELGCGATIVGVVTLMTLGGIVHDIYRYPSTEAIRKVVREELQKKP